MHVFSVLLLCVFVKRMEKAFHYKFTEAQLPHCELLCSLQRYKASNMKEWKTCTAQNLAARFTLF